MITSVLFSKALWSIAGAAVISGGTGAAYAGVLPDSLQQFAHRTIGAPATTVTTQQNAAAPAPTTNVKPQPTSPTTIIKPQPTTKTVTVSHTVAASPAQSNTSPSQATKPTETKLKLDKSATRKWHGLCQALQRGGIPANSRSHAKLAAAAGGTDQIADFCKKAALSKSKADAQDKAAKYKWKQDRKAKKAALKALRAQAKAKRAAELAAKKTATAQTPSGG